MSVKQVRRASFLAILVVALAATAANAETSTYQVRGSGAGLWAVGDQPGTEFLALTFNDLLNTQGRNPAPEARITFSLTRWSVVNNAYVRRQWYGDVAVKPDALQLGTDFVQATMEVDVLGSLEERTLTGVTVRRDVPGRVQMRWIPSGILGLVTSSYIYSTPAYLVTLQAIGQGRAASTTATVTVEALGGAVNVAGYGSLTGTTNGNLTVAMQ